MVFMYLGSITNLLLFHMPATLVDATNCGLGSVLHAFEQVCALREESPVLDSSHID